MQTNLSRFFVRFSLVSILSFTSLFAQNQDNKNQDKAPGPYAPLLAIQAGEYRFIQYDRGELQKKYLNEVFGRAEKDREYFQKTVEGIEAEFALAMETAVYRVGVSTIEDGILKISRPVGLFWLSRHSKASSAFVQSEDFMNAVDSFYQAQNSIKLRIKTLTAIQEGALPSKVDLKADGSGLAEVPQHGNLNFAPLIKFYDDKLKEIVGMLDKLPFNIKVRDTKHLSIGLVLPNSILELTEVELDRIQAEMISLRSWKAKQHDIIDDYTKFTRILIQKFIANYGYRWYRLNENEQAAREKEARVIAEAFWTRSYLRAAYGMPIGAIGIDYQPVALNLDFLVVSTDALGRFIENPAWSGDGFDRIEQNFRNCLLRAGVRAEKLLDGNLGFLASAENLVVYLSGKRNQAQAQLMMLALLAADVYEERLVQSAGGIAKMKARFRDRYLKTDEEKKYYGSLRVDYDPKTTEKDTATGINPRSLLGQFREARAVMRKKEVDLARAAQLEATWNMATGANQFAADREQRIDDLFGK